MAKGRWSWRSQERRGLERPLHWHYPHYGNQGGEPSSIIREGDWKLIHYWEDGREELFHLPSVETDELNVIEKHPEIAAGLSEKLSSWLREAGANLPEKDPDYDEQMNKKRHDEIVNELLPQLERQRMEFLSKDFQPNEDWRGSKTNID